MDPGQEAYRDDIACFVSEPYCRHRPTIEDFLSRTENVVWPPWAEGGLQAPIVHTRACVLHHLADERTEMGDLVGVVGGLGEVGHFVGI